jgi:deoxyribodipyrimidine photolyase
MAKVGQNFYGPVGGATAKGDVYVTQTNQTTEQNFDVLFSDFKKFIADLQTKYPSLHNEVDIAQIIDVEAKLIEAKDQNRWQNFLNLKRLWNGGKKAALKVGEHFVEQNPWGKGAIAFLEGVSEDPK